MQRILILKADRVCGEALRDAAERLFPDAAVLLVGRIEFAGRILEALPVDLLVTGLDLPDGDALDFIFSAARSLRRAARVLVVSQHHEPRVLALLHAWRVDGVLDPAEGPRGFAHALQTLAAGQWYWTARLRAAARSDRVLRRLSAAELVVLGAIADGCDDKTAAARLGRAASTIATTRKNLHRKLGLRHKGELVEWAAQNGFVRFSRGAVVRPGFEQQRAAYASRPRRKRGAPGKAGDSVVAA